MKIERLTLRRAGPGIDPAAWSAELASGAWLAASKLLKSDGPSWVRRATLLGRDVVIKCRPAGRNETLKRLVRSTRGDRHWRGAAFLASHGFDTPETILLADALVDRTPSELLLTTFVDAPSLLEHLHAKDLDVKREHAAARALGQHISALLVAGRYNRDGKPSNLLLMPAGDTFRVVTLDCVAIRRGRSFRAYKRSLANLLLEPIGTGSRPRLALCARVVRQLTGAPPRDPDERNLWWVDRANSWSKVQEHLAAHGDPTPRVDPLKH